MKKNVYKKIVKHIGKDLYLFILLFGVVIFTSCITPIKRDSIPSVSIYEPMHNEQLIMEFIGFKTDANVLSTTQSTKLGPWRREITLLSSFVISLSVNPSKVVKLCLCIINSLSLLVKLDNLIVPLFIVPYTFLELTIPNLYIYIPPMCPILYHKNIKKIKLTA